jgi:hypothetical protein
MSLVTSLLLLSAVIAGSWLAGTAFGYALFRATVLVFERLEKLFGGAK